MPKKRLVRYVAKYLGKYDEEQIRKRLLKDGWKKKEIDSAVEVVKKKKDSSKEKAKDKKSKGKAKKAKPKLTKKDKSNNDSKKKEQKIKAHETRNWEGIKHRSPVLA